MKIFEQFAAPCHPVFPVGVPQVSGDFIIMNKKFHPEYETDIFINGNNGVSVEQNGEIIAMSSKSRAIEIGNAILEMAELATFQVDPEDEL